MKLIDKDALVAEIENLLDKGRYHEEYDCAYRDGNNSALYALKGKIDTLEVKDVDLEKEFDDYIEKQNAFTNNDNSEIKYYNGDSFNHVYDIYPIAKHFFELGMAVSIKEQKGEEV